MKIILILAFASTVYASIWSQKSKKGCNRLCGKEIEPICGSDGVIYQNICELRRRNCGPKKYGKNEIFPVSDEYCMMPYISKCSHRCSKHIFEPVCGSDARTYMNKCIFRVQQCTSGVNMAHSGPCFNSVARSNDCPLSCMGVKANDPPICGSDGNAYNSTCDMQYRTCGEKVVKTSLKNCQTTKRCNDICYYDYKPVCGSDSQIYHSKCQMKVKNCGKHIYEMPMVRCRTQERTTSACPISCDEEKISPVCGSDGNIYDNECDMKRLNCGTGNARNIYSISLKRCKERFQTCEKITCPSSQSIDPVCGTDGKTYKNYCLLYKAQCMKKVKFAHYGICARDEDLGDCEAPCNEIEEEQRPVCGSDGNAYQSRCEMKRRTCGQKVVEVELHHCKSTKKCFYNCDKEKRKIAVCGSDGKMYSSECEMKKRNCGHHVYEVPLSECMKDFNFFDCLRFCPSTFEPVCGSDGKTYSNECFLTMENCRSRSLGRSLVTRIYYGRCGAPQPQAKLYLFR